MRRTPVATFQLQQGSEVIFKGRTVAITHLLDFQSALVKDAATGEVVRAKISELTATSGSEAVPTPDIEQIPDQDWQVAQRRMEIVRPLVGRPDRRRSDVSKRAEEFGMTTGTVYAWLSAYESTGRVTSLLPRTRSDKGSLKLKKELELIIQSVIEDEYLSGQRKTISKVFEMIRDRCLTAGIDSPHPNTVRNRIARMSESFRVKRRHGRQAADEQFAPNDGKFPGADWPLAVVQIDHTKLDIILVDDFLRRPIGRPWITLAIDVFSRMIVGFYISFDPPGALATGLCVANSVLPKDELLLKHDLDAEWPVWGFPRTLHMDNAREFRGAMLQKACEEYGIDINWRPVARPHFGGHIERLLGTVLKEIHTLPGTTFSNPAERGAYDSEAKAALTLSEFEKWLATYITKVHHQRRHSGIGMSPLAKFREGIFGNADRPGSGLPARVADEQRLRLDFMPFVERTVQTYGVVVDEIHYYHDVLRQWIGTKEPGASRQKRKLLFRQDPRDISKLWFYDPELMTYFEIPYRDTSHPAMSVWELREAQRAAKASGEPIDERAIFEAYERMRAIEAEAVSKTKSARMSAQRRRDGLTGSRSMSDRDSMPKAPLISPNPEANETSDSAILPFDELDALSHG